MSDPMCAFTAGSRWCVNDRCPNPNHRTPDPATGGIVPPPRQPAKSVARATSSRPRRQPHCGHGTTVDRYGDQAPDCPYCAENIDPDDFWDIVRFLNTRRRERTRAPVKPRAAKRDKNRQPEHTMRPCDVCGQPMLLNRDRECAITPGCTGWHTLTTGAEP